MMDTGSENTAPSISQIKPSSLPGSDVDMSAAISRGQRQFEATPIRQPGTELTNLGAFVKSDPVACAAAPAFPLTAERMLGLPASDSLLASHTNSTAPCVPPNDGSPYLPASTPDAAHMAMFNPIPFRRSDSAYSSCSSFTPTPEQNSLGSDSSKPATPTPLTPWLPGATGFSRSSTVTGIDSRDSAASIQTGSLATWSSDSRLHPLLSDGLPPAVFGRGHSATASAGMVTVAPGSAPVRRVSGQVRGADVRQPDGLSLSSISGIASHHQHHHPLQRHRRNSSRSSNNGGPRTLFNFNDFRVPDSPCPSPVTPLDGPVDVFFGESPYSAASTPSPLFDRERSASTTSISSCSSLRELRSTSPRQLQTPTAGLREQINQMDLRSAASISRPSASSAPSSGTFAAARRSSSSTSRGSATAIPLSQSHDSATAAHSWAQSFPLSDPKPRTASRRRSFSQANGDDDYDSMSFPDINSGDFCRSASCTPSLEASAFDYNQDASASKRQRSATPNNSSINTTIKQQLLFDMEADVIANNIQHQQQHRQRLRSASAVAMPTAPFFSPPAPSTSTSRAATIAPIGCNVANTSVSIDVDDQLTAEGIFNTQEDADLVCSGSTVIASSQGSDDLPCTEPISDHDTQDDDDTSMVDAEVQSLTLAATVQAANGVSFAPFVTTNSISAGAQSTSSAAAASVTGLTVYRSQSDSVRCRSQGAISAVSSTMSLPMPMTSPKIAPMVRCDSVAVMDSSPREPLEGELPSALNVRGDRKALCALPTTSTQHSMSDEIRCISPETLHRVLHDEHNEKIQNFIVVDCRFPYEFDGGHISGAHNIWRCEETVDKFLVQPVVDIAGGENTAIIFHCEFSSHRGPTQFKFLRELDRFITISNADLIYPEMYLLEGGYKSFVAKFPGDCVRNKHLQNPAYRPPKEATPLYLPMNATGCGVECNIQENILKCSRLAMKEKRWESSSQIQELYKAYQSGGFTALQFKVADFQASINNNAGDNEHEPSPRTPYSQIIHSN